MLGENSGKWTYCLFHPIYATADFLRNHCDVTVHLFFSHQFYTSFEKQTNIDALAYFMHLLAHNFKEKPNTLQEISVLYFNLEYLFSSVFIYIASEGEKGHEWAMFWQSSGNRYFCTHSHPFCWIDWCLTILWAFWHNIFTIPACLLA